MLAVLLLASGLAACGSAPAVRYHSLLPAGGSTPPAATLSWQLAAVTIPAQLDQPQWLVRLPDESLRLLEQERWAGPLGDELRAALSEAITRRLGMPGLAKPPSGQGWRIRVDVQRLELMPARQALLVSDWRVAGVEPSAPQLQCRDLQQRSISGGFDALAAAQRDAVAALGERIAAALATMDRGGAAACPG